MQLQPVQFFKIGREAHEAVCDPAVTDAKQMTDFVETYLGRPCAGDIRFFVGNPVKRYKCGFAAQLGLSIDKGKDRGADVIPGDPKGQWNAAGIRCEGVDDFRGVILKPAVTVCIFGFRQSRSYVAIQAHDCLEIGGHDRYGQFIDCPYRDNVQVTLIMFQRLSVNGSKFPNRVQERVI